MIKSIIKLLVILVIGILIYNYFLGSKDEKENARKIFTEVKDVGVAVKDLLKSEKQKFDTGKYDKAVEKMEGVLDKLKKNAEGFDEKYLDRIEELESKRQAIEREISEYEDVQERIEKDPEFTPKGGQDTARIKQDMDELMRETEQLIRDMEKQN